ncbi:MAG: 3-phosphoshikimate 1-carboxyvinyltransferase, partial [Endomicrobiales bacterium]
TPAALIVQGVGMKGLKSPGRVVDAGNSGTTARLLSGILAGQDFSVTIMGDQSLSRRPMQRIIEPLRRMGAEITARKGNFLPLEIRGTPRLKPIRHKSAVPSAQVKSCVLLAGLQANGVTSFSEPLKSRDHTERMLRARGVELTSDECAVKVKGPAKLSPLDMRVPGDISSAAFLLVAGSIVHSSRVVLFNVGVNPTRDGVIEVLKGMGARITFLKSEEVSGEPVADLLVENSELGAVKIGTTIMPRLIDEIPALVLAATQAFGTTVVSGAGELRVKESDRLKTISSELGKMGADIHEKEDGLV